MMDCYSTLANAVIIQAVKDYRTAYRKLLKSPDSREALHEVKALERFFVSPWYESLTDVDGKMLLRKVKEAEQRKAGRRKLT